MYKSFPSQSIHKKQSSNIIHNLDFHFTDFSYPDVMEGGVPLQTAAGSVVDDTIHV